MVRGINTPRLAAWFLLFGVSALVPAADGLREGVHCRPLKSYYDMATELCVCQPCHLCEFSLTEGKCALIPFEGRDLSDGSDVEIDQPTLDPSLWFLTEDEITSSRGGFPREDLSVFTSGNQVTGFVASNEYFHAVYDDIESCGADHRIFLTGWSVDQVPFKPQEDPTGEATNFATVFGNAISRGANFHALVWSNLLETEQNVKMRDLLHSIPSTDTGGKAHFIFDDRLAAHTNAHHQKSVIIERKDDLVAYVGGVDLTSDRWDTIHHDQDELRTQTGIQRIYNGWVDAHVRIVGPATKDVAANFLARWNSDTKPSTDIIDDVLNFENPDSVDLPIGTCGIDPETDGKHTGTHNVQIARTFSCEYKNYEFAPRGETSIFQARIKAIRNAKNYIYIEDQYFVLVPQLLDELLKVLPRLQRIIVMVPRPDSSATLGGYEKFMYDNVEPIQKKYPNKFQFFTTKKSRSIYVHSKLVIIDAESSPQAEKVISRDERSPTESPVRVTRERMTRADSVSPARQRRDHTSRRDASDTSGDELMDRARGDGGHRSVSPQKRIRHSSTVDDKHNFPSKKFNDEESCPKEFAGDQSGEGPGRLTENMDLRKNDRDRKSEKASVRAERPGSGNQRLSHTVEVIEYGPGRIEDERSIMDHVPDEQSFGKKRSREGSVRGGKTEALQKSTKRADHNNRTAASASDSDSDSEEDEKYRSEEMEKRKHKKSDRHQMNSDDDASSDTQIDARKEAKRRRKEEKRLRKEEKRRRREERHRKREERRAGRLKSKSRDAVTLDVEKNRNAVDDLDGDVASKRESLPSDVEETETEQKKLEIELRKKALESLRAKKAINP